MEAICSSETSIDFQRTTQRYIPDDSSLHNQCSEDLNSYWEGTGRVLTKGPSQHLLGGTKGSHETLRQNRRSLGPPEYESRVLPVRQSTRFDRCFWVRLPLWSSGQSFWLQIERSRVRFPVLPRFLRSSGSGMGSTQTREYN
jgi:hypothetical protein